MTPSVDKSPRGDPSTVEKIWGDPSTVENILGEPSTVGPVFPKRGDLSIIDPYGSIEDKTPESFRYFTCKFIGFSGVGG